MSSSGIQAVSSGPLIIRTYNESSSSDVTYVLKDYDYPVSSNFVLITSTNGQLVPSDNIYISSITTSSFQSDFGRFSTIYQSSVFGFSPINFYSPIRINNQTPSEGVQLFVDGNVGIGTINPQTTLDVVGDIYASTGFITQGTRYLDGPTIIYGDDINSTILQYYYDNTSLFDTLELAPAGGYRSQIKFNTATSGSPTQASTQMILSHDGRLGIGTTTPSYKLDVNGVGQIPSLIVSSITTNAPSLNISTIGNLNITGNLNVGGAINHPDVAPVGSILMYAASSAPNGWLLCDGTIHPNIDYPELQQIIQYNFGGNGTTTFAVPDMRARFPVGIGTGYSMGQTGGFVSTTLTTNQLPSHSHSITDPGHTHTATSNLEYNNTDPGGETSNCYETDEPDGLTGGFTITIASANTGITGTNATGSGQPFDNRPPYFAINYIIKY
jgi:microcystin-dependent protein